MTILRNICPPSQIGKSILNTVMLNSTDNGLVRLLGTRGENGEVVPVKDKDVRSISHTLDFSPGQMVEVERVGGRLAEWVEAGRIVVVPHSLEEIDKADAKALEKMVKDAHIKCGRGEDARRDALRFVLYGIPLPEVTVALGD